MLHTGIHPKHPQKIEHGTFVKTVVLIARPCLGSGTLWYLPIMFLDKIGRDFFLMKERQMLGDQRGIAMGWQRRKTDRGITGFLRKLVEGHAAIEKLVAPIVTVIDKDQKAGAGQTLRHRQLCLAAFFPLPAAIELDDNPPIICFMNVDSVVIRSSIL
jgi:hypothetical protein